MKRQIAVPLKKLAVSLCPISKMKTISEMSHQSNVLIS